LKSALRVVNGMGIQAPWQGEVQGDVLAARELASA